MSFLKTLFWVIFLVGFTVFAINNWPSDSQTFIALRYTRR